MLSIPVDFSFTVMYNIIISKRLCQDNQKLAFGEYMKDKDRFGVFASIIEKAKAINAKIVLPEGYDSRVIEAANWAAENNLCRIVLLGSKQLIEPRLTRKAQKTIEIIDPKAFDKKREMYANTLYELRKHKGMTEELALKQLNNNLVFAMMMLYSDDADGIVAGAVAETAEVLRPAFQIIKNRKDVSKVSSSMIIQMPPKSPLGENGLMVFADCAVNENPTDEELADIALLSAETGKTICGMRPNVALLSYTTKANEDFDNENVQKIKRAYKIARRKNPSLRIDGEMQGDAALDAEVCNRKCHGSDVDGKANVLVFPDLFSANIAYKLVSRIAGVKAVGPILQGLNKPVNDLSRGTTADEIILNIAITALQTRETIKGF